MSKLAKHPHWPYKGIEITINKRQAPNTTTIAASKAHFPATRSSTSNA